MEEKFCFVIEMVEWDHDTDGLHLHLCPEFRHICRVCLDYEDAKSFVEQHAKATNEPYDMRWRGDRRYSGSYEEGGMRYGLDYVLHYVALC